MSNETESSDQARALQWLEGSCSKSLASPIDHEGKRAGHLWKVPQFRPTESQLREAVTALDLLLKRGGGAAVRGVMSDLMLTTQTPSTEGMGFMEIKAVTLKLAAEYIEQLRHVPADLLKAAAVRCSMSSPWFPKPAHLLEVADPEMAERLAMKRRAHHLLDTINAPTAAAAAQAFKPMTPEEQKAATIVRLREGIPIYLKHGKIDSAQRAEDQLAKLEGRAATTITSHQGVTNEEAPQGLASS